MSTLEGGGGGGGVGGGYSSGVWLSFAVCKYTYVRSLTEVVGNGCSAGLQWHPTLRAHTALLKGLAYASATERVHTYVCVNVRIYVHRTLVY